MRSRRRSRARAAALRLKTLVLCSATARAGAASRCVFGRVATGATRLHPFGERRCALALVDEALLVCRGSRLVVRRCGAARLAQLGGQQRRHLRALRRRERAA
jgi:hypothetical protein